MSRPIQGGNGTHAGPGRRQLRSDAQDVNRPALYGGFAALLSVLAVRAGLMPPLPTGRGRRRGRDELAVRQGLSPVLGRLWRARSRMRDAASHARLWRRSDDVEAP